MLLIQLITLAVVQGVTEFLPISSSGHLVILPHLSMWPDQGLVYDVAAHFGSLIAVVGYFHRDIRNIVAACFAQVRGGGESQYSRLGWAVMRATVPVCVIGLMFHDFIATYLREPLIIAATTLVFGAVLWVADVYGRRDRELTSIGWIDIGIIGVSQTLALIPGTSRSGITMSAALAVGLTREAAARFSFLLSIPVIVLAAGYESLNLMNAGVSVDWTGLAVVTVGSAASALVCIALFLRFIERLGMLPFVVYRFFLAAVLVYLFW